MAASITGVECLNSGLPTFTLVLANTFLNKVVLFQNYKKVKLGLYQASFFLYNITVSTIHFILERGTIPNNGVTASFDVNFQFDLNYTKYVYLRPKPQNAIYIFLSPTQVLNFDNQTNTKRRKGINRGKYRREAISERGRVIL